MPSWKKVLISGSDAALNSLIVTNGITGSLFGTASYAIQALSASYALTSSYSQNLQISGSIANVDYIDFNTGSATPAYKSGRVFFDNVDGALSVYNAEADITLQVGQESWVRVFNEGTTITNGTAVRLVGSHGDVPLIVRAQSAQVSGSALGDNQIIGVATHTIETNSIGYVTTQGLTRGLNTSAFADGDLLFVSSSAGLITNVIPQAPFEVIQVGICVKAGPGGSGIIFVFPTQPIDFGDLASAERGTYTYGDLWSYQQSGSVGIWKHTNQLSGSYGITGSLSVTAGITGSLFGTASYTNVGSLGGFIQGGNSFGTTATLGTNDNNSLALETNGTTKMFISSSGNVGIGTTSPATKLDVVVGTANSDIAQFSGAVQGRGLKISTFTTGTTDAGVLLNAQSTSQGAIAFATSGAEAMRISNNGNVGIGTTAPIAKLHISSSAGDQIKLDRTGQTDRAILINSSDQLALGTWLSPNQLNITAAGNVGIGTTTPTNRLQVQPALTGFDLNGLSNGAIALTNNSNGGVAPTIGGKSTTNGQPGLQFVIGTNDTNTNADMVFSVRESDNTDFSTLTSSAYRFSRFTTSLLEILRNGNVGIGTTAPATKLHIAGITRIDEGGNTAFYAGNYIRLFNDQNLNIRNSGGTTVANISVSGSSYFNGGNVGIGTTSPSSKLHLSVGNVDGIRVESSNSGYLETGKTGGARWRWANEYSADNLFQLLVNDLAGGVPNLPVLAVTGSGNVGIGTSAPLSKFHVKATTNQNLRVAGGSTLEINSINDADSAYIPVTFRASSFNFSNGNVGIGTTSPAAKLDIYVGASGGAAANSDDNLIIEDNGNSFLNFKTPATGVSGLIFSDLTRGQGQVTYDHNLDALRFVTSGVEKVRILSSGNVGIGTTTPSYTLDVSGSAGSTVRFKGSGQSTVSLNDGTNDNFIVGTGGRIDIRPSGSQAVSVLGNGNVGIGTTAPAAKLHISGTGLGGTVSITDTAITDTNYNTLRLFAATQNKFALGVGTSTSYPSHIVIDGTTGNVGIGTTAPGAKLDVEGDVLIKAANLSNQENTDVDTGTEVVATVAIATYTAAFFDFVVKNGTNVRSGTVFACHDGTNVEFTETSTADLGTTSALTLSVDISSGNMRLLATATTDNWSVKTLVRAL